MNQKPTVTDPTAASQAAGAPRMIAPCPMEFARRLVAWARRREAEGVRPGADGLRARAALAAWLAGEDARRRALAMAGPGLRLAPRARGRRRRRAARKAADPPGGGAARDRREKREGRHALQSARPP